ncbi:hypothetical protein DL96DRAFT_1582321 [Flagelloscypha sp. PMI_526]|nr:hypothetical protein DL96DRAFT_1582321 [Flagelloscypha sp. PMI_526]
MPSFISVVKRITQRPSKKSSSPSTSKDTQFKTDVRLDYCITSARLLKAVGENLPFPWLKGASDLVLQVLEPLRLARTNQQDFDSLAQDILDTLRPIQEQAARLNLEGSLETRFVELKCASFTVKSDTLSNSSSAWTTPTMQRLIQSYQSRLQKEVQMFNLSNMVDIHASVHKTAIETQIMSAKLDTVLAPPLTKKEQPELENYRSLKAGDLRVVATRNQERETESHVLYKGKKTWKTFHDDDAEKRWIEEIQFYHTSRLQPRVRQLFGFTQSQDFLGLVFHEHSMSPVDVWSKMAPIESIFSQAHFFHDWNEALHFLSSTPFGQLVNKETYFGPHPDSLTPENDRLSLRPLVDCSGALQVTLSSNRNRNPAGLYFFLHPISGEPYKPQDIQSLQDVFLSHHSHISHSHVTELYNLISRMLPGIHAGFETTIRAAVSLRVDAPGTGFSSIAEINLPLHLVTVTWKNWPGSPKFSLPRASWQRTIIPDSPGTSYFTFSSKFESMTDINVAFQLLPRFWNRVNESNEFRHRATKLTFDHPGFINLVLRVDVLVPESHVLYLFIQQELQVDNGIVDLSDIFYLSFDSLGASRLTERDLHRSGFMITHSFYHLRGRRQVSVQARKAILELADSSSLTEDLAAEKFLQWPAPVTRRSSSVDRMIRTPNPHRVHTSLHHRRYYPSGHEPLCELAGDEECVCLEARRQCVARGSFTDRFTEDIREPKRQRARSIDSANRITTRILRWMALAQNIGITSSGELRDWYLFPAMFDSYENDPQRICFSNRPVSPWMVLVDPSGSEQVGRPTLLRPHLPN